MAKAPLLLGRGKSRIIYKGPHAIVQELNQRVMKDVLRQTVTLSLHSVFQHFKRTHHVQH